MRYSMYSMKMGLSQEERKGELTKTRRNKMGKM
jgi:hypothetical protein